MPDRDRERQLPLDLGHSAGRAREDIVVSDANREAVGLIDRWPDWPGPVLLLAGPAGAGKTHLSAAWAERAGALALDASAIGQPAAAPAYWVDDADRPDRDERGLFHLINTVHGAGGHLLLTARRFAPAWGVALPDLASRLKAAATVEIREPDDLLLAGVITKLFADRQVEVEPHVVQYLVRRIERSLATAIRVVERLDGVALEQKSRITRALAAETLSALDLGQGELDLE